MPSDGLSMREQIECDRLRDFADGMAILDLGLTKHADRREHALEQVAFPQKHAARLATIADLRRRAACARADRAAALAAIDEITKRSAP